MSRKRNKNDNFKQINKNRITIFSNLKNIFSPKVIPWLSLLISLFVLFYGIIKDCNQDIKIDEINYNNNAIQYRPILKMIGEPKLIIKSLKGPKRATRDLVTAYDSNYILADGPINIGLNLKVKIKNFGNSIANLHSLIWADTLSGSDEIRSALLNKSFRDQIFKIDASKEYYNIKDITPNDSTELNFLHTVQYIENKTFIIHVFLLYLNERGVLYDTYYWLRYITKDFQYKTEVEKIGKDSFLRFKYSRDQLFHLLKSKDYNMSTKIYNKDQAEDILNFLEKIH